jgi:transposase
MQIAILGIDLGKNSCSMAGLDEAGRVLLRRRVRRESVIKFVSGLPACVVAMEACGGPIISDACFRNRGMRYG